MKRLTWLAFALYLTINQAAMSTTIAWDGHILAADSQMTMIAGKSERKLLNCPKIHYSARHQAWIALAGSVPDIELYLEHFITGKPLPPHWSGEFEALIVHKNGSAELIMANENQHIEVPTPFAFGSGEDAAMAAMYAGKNAAEAIAVTELVDLYTGGPISVVHVKP